MARTKRNYLYNRFNPKKYTEQDLELIYNTMINLYNKYYFDYTFKYKKTADEFNNEFKNLVTVIALMKFKDKDNVN